MPFTFSHPALILPLQRHLGKWFSFSGLVAGSLAPDFEHFFRLEQKSIYGHTWSGIVWFDLPVGFFLLFIFHQLVKEPLITNMPDLFRSRFEIVRTFDWSMYLKQNWKVILFSLVLGSFSHVVADKVVHRIDYFINEVRFYPEMIDGTRYIFPVWYISSIIGLLYLFLFTIRQTRTTIQNRFSGKYWYWLAIIFLSVVLIILFKKEIFLNFTIAGIRVTSIFLSTLVIVSCLYMSFDFLKCSLQKKQNQN